MGKVLVKGHAERETAPDFSIVKLTVETEGATAAKAATAAMTEYEKLIQALNDLGLKTECMMITEDESKSSSTHWDKDDHYTSKKSFRINLPVDISLINAIHDLIASGFENTAITVLFDVSNRASIKNELKKEAIQDSRKKAELLAETTSTKVTGIESANLEGYGSMDMDIANLDLAADEHYGERHCYAARSMDSDEKRLADMLIPRKITLSEDVRIVWLLE